MNTQNIQDICMMQTWNLSRPPRPELHILFNFNQKGGQITDNDAFLLFIAGKNSLDLRVFSV